MIKESVQVESTTKLAKMVSEPLAVVYSVDCGEELLV